MWDFFMARKKRKTKYKEPLRIKVGRCLYVGGYDKKPIIGLSWDSANGYYFPTHFKDTDEYRKTEKRPHFTKDYDNAIMEFRAWKEKQEGGKSLKIAKPEYQESIKANAELVLTDEFAEALEKSGFHMRDLIEFIKIQNVHLTELLIIQKSKEIFAKYPPSIVAEKFGMPSLVKIDYAEDLRDPHTLKEIGECYFNRVEFKEPIKELKREVSKVKKVWKQFYKMVDAQNCKELTKKDIKEFYNSIYGEYSEKQYSPTWIKGKFERIKRVFNNAIDELDDVDDIITARRKIGSILKISKRISKRGVKEKPYRIPKEHFHIFLGHSNIEERCMWLLSMNLAYYSVDVASLPLSAINLEDKVVVFRRGKTGNHRSGVLWDITIDSIKAYQNAISHNGSTLFWNRQGNVPYLPNRIRKKFVAVAEKAGLRGQENKRLCHRNFRDSLKSIAFERGIRNASVNAVMGHHNEHDEYVDPEVYPKVSEEACLAVYDYYFNDSKKKV